MKSKNCSPCHLIRYREFSSLFFGNTDDEMTYFNASDYIKEVSDNKKHNIKEFQIGFFFWIKSVSSVLNIDFDELIIIDENTKKILIEESLALIFLAYVHPEFGIYLIQSMDEMLQEGVVISDSYLMHKARERLSEHDLTNLFKDEEK